MKQSFDYTKHLSVLVPLLIEVEKMPQRNKVKLRKLLHRFTKPTGDVFARDELITAYRELAGTKGLAPYQDKVISVLKMKPVRTASGVAPVTVLTKPFPCPGKCIFCPSDIRMPKSYLSDEPGAQRAERNWFDPYLQTYNRLLALHTIGHTIDKVEIIVLGGTWSYYPEAYQIWFIKECFRALNDFKHNDDREQVLSHYKQMQKKLEERKEYAPTSDPKINKKNLSTSQIDGQIISQTYNQVISQKYVAPERIAGFDAYQSASWDELYMQQKKNETADCRCVGLVVETRPDNISEAEIIRIRKLGCTKAQIGFQSLQDEVLKKNKRGHDVAATRRAVNLLRQAGFKVHAHWMANLYGSSVELDKRDFQTLFDDPDFMPDELKVYPCSLIGSAELMQYYKKGLWKPYTYEELLEVLSFALMNTPEYCRLTRVIRDIPSTDIVEGNKYTNFRQIAEQSLARANKKSKDIRAREIRNKTFKQDAIKFEIVQYETSVSTEHFLQYIADGSLLGFLRLSLPTGSSFISELKGSAIIREIHVYGSVAKIGTTSKTKAQHLGLGTKLIERARVVASEHGFEDLAVISAIGTREYYRKKGFADGELYQHYDLSADRVLST